jgi:hypothetical protein
MRAADTALDSGAAQMMRTIQTTKKKKKKKTPPPWHGFESTLTSK